MSRGRRGGSGRDRHGWSPAIVLACLGLTAAWVAPAALADVDPPIVTVEHGKVDSEVQGRFEVPVPLLVAWDVLTDYDHIADFVGSMRSSAVESRSHSGLTLRQEVVAGVFPFRKVAHLLLSVREQPDTTIEFHDLLDRDFRLYQGGWELHPGLSGTAVTYHLHAQPVSSIPRFIDHAVLSRAVMRLLTQVQAEMIRRGGAQEDP
jgi:hypothetical protein